MNASICAGGSENSECVLESRKEEVDVVLWMRKSRYHPLSSLLVYSSKYLSSSKYHAFLWVMVVV